VPRDEEETTVPPERLESERPEYPMLLRVVGMFSLVLGALIVYFAGAAEDLDETAVAAADLALVRALRVVAGACAISGFAIGIDPCVRTAIRALAIVTVISAAYRRVRRQQPPIPVNLQTRLQPW
jgi:hypothetical protein